MYRYMLDTDTVSLAIQGKGKTGQRILRHSRSSICTSSLVVAELRFGAERKNSQRLHDLISSFLSNVDVLPFDTDAAAEFGRVCSELERKGKPIGPFDTLIAAHALSLELTLVTSNAKHLGRVKGLSVESWT